MNLEGLNSLALVEDKVGGEEHEEGELVTLALEPGTGNVKGKPRRICPSLIK